MITLDRATRINLILTGVVVLVLVVLLPAAFYVVDERELAVVLQFGQPVAERTEPGVYVKVPFVQEVRKLPATRQFWGGGPTDVLPDLPTRDGKKIEVIPWALWRVQDPKQVVQRLVTLERAEQRVADFVRGAMRDVITQYDLAEFVRSTDRELTYTIVPAVATPTSPTGSATDDAQRVGEVEANIEHGREKILARIKQEAMRRLSAGEETDTEGSRGIEIVDVGIAKIDFVPTVRQAAFDRLIAFMQSLAAGETNQGERQRQEILNRTKAEVQRIEGEGKQQANQIRGDADAEIIRMFAKAIEQADEFYTFVRTLEAYKKALGNDTQLILTTDNEFLRFLKEPTLPGSQGAGSVGQRSNE